MKHSTGDEPWWLQLTDGGLPVDTLVAALYAVCAGAVVLATGTDALRVVVGLPFLLFVPGYCVLTVLYPGTAASGRLVGDDGINDVERVALSFGASLALLPPVGLVVWVVAGGFDAAAVVGVVTFTTVALAAVGTVRRLRLPPAQRYDPSVRDRGGRLVGALTTGDANAVLNVVLVVAVAVAVVTAMYVAAVPTDGTTYTGFRLLTEQAGGGYVASGYPAELATGESASLVVGVENHENRDVRYTVVVELQRVTTADGAVTVRTADELSRLGATVADGETAHLEHAVEPTMTGDDLRLRYYLYRGDAPADPSEETAYRTLSLWVDVETDEGQTALGDR